MIFKGNFNIAQSIIFDNQFKYKDKLQIYFPRLSVCSRHIYSLEKKFQSDFQNFIFWLHV